MELWVRGKSIELLKVAHNYIERGHDVLLITSSLDDRFGKDKITTRIGISKEAIAVTKNENLYEIVYNHLNNNKLTCILVDEVQFLTTKQIDELSDVVDYLNIPVICYGIKVDFLTNSFEGSKRLFEVADDIEEIKTVCECLRKATHNARFINGVIATTGEQIFIGDSEYKSLCRKCYKEKIKEANIFKLETSNNVEIENIISENYNLKEIENDKNDKNDKLDMLLNIDTSEDIVKDKYDENLENEDEFSSIFNSTFNIDDLKEEKDGKSDEIIDKYIKDPFEELEELDKEKEKEVIEALEKYSDINKTLENEVIKIYKEGVHYI